MIKHYVMFRLKRPVDEVTRARFIEGLRAFADEAPFTVGEVEVRESLLLRGDSPRTADAFMAATFERAEDFVPYIESAPHRALVKDLLEPSCEGWWSVQFEG